jgi:hypothetical protein
MNSTGYSFSMGASLMPGQALMSYMDLAGSQPEHTISLEITYGLARPTEWWKQLDPDDTKTPLFLLSEIFSDDEGSMHDQERHLRIKFKNQQDYHRDHPQHVDGWMQAPATRSIFIKLALTPITVFDFEWFRTWRLRRNYSPCRLLIYGPAHIDSQELHGPIHRLLGPSALPAATIKKPAVIPNVSTPSSEKNSKGVSFDAGVKATSLFLSRKACSALPPAAQAKADLRKFNDNFYTIETPPMDADWREGGPEATANFKDAIGHILNKDKKAIIHMWNPDRSGGILAKKTDPLKNRIQVKKFASQLYIRQGFPTKYRLRVSHDVLPSLLELSSDSGGLTITHDHIQECDCMIIGFLVGLSPLAANMDDMQEAHENHPVLHVLKVTALDQAIKLAPGKDIFPWEQQVKAIHIVVGASQASKARNNYSHVYGSCNQGGVPQGIQMRFVSDISDSHFPITKNTRIKAIKMMSKQKMLLANTKYIHTCTIAGIHIVIPKIGFPSVKS